LSEMKLLSACKAGAPPLRISGPPSAPIEAPLVTSGGDSGPGCPTYQSPLERRRSRGPISFFYAEAPQALAATLVFLLGRGWGHSTESKCSDRGHVDHKGRGNSPTQDWALCPRGSRSIVALAGSCLTEGALGGSRAHLVLDSCLIGPVVVAEIGTRQPPGDKFHLFDESGRLLALQN